MRKLLENSGAVVGLLLILALPVALLIGVVATILISLIWGILTFIGIVVIFGGIGVIIYKQPKIGIILIIIGIVLVVASTTFGLEIGTIDFSEIQIARMINSFGG